MTHSSTEPHTDTAADRAFARFCRTGDADALAEVFDRTAPKLAMLAGHLVPGDAQAVEDLVQTTFLEAMRAARRFEPGRPVMPWLVTILGRRAANHRRGARRRAPADLPERAAGTDGTLDPAALAADREVAARVAETIDRLASPYREALSLRLVHGLTPAEIARALGRPLGTVHAQLHRGAERLRRMLPPATALALAGLLSVRDGLAAVRTTVLHTARDAAVTATAAAGTAGLVGGMLMTKKLAGIVAVLVASAALVWLARPWLAEPAPARGSEPTVDAQSARVTRASGEQADRGEAPGGVRRETTTKADSETISFTGRVVTADASNPLPRATVKAQFYARQSIYSLPAELAVPRVTTTGPDGRYRLELPPNGNDGITILISAPGRATMAASWSEAIRPGAVVDSGVVPMALGTELSLRVLDENGEPVQAFEIQLRPPAGGPTSSDGAFVPFGWGGIQETDARGIAGPRSVIAGAWGVEYAEGTGHRYAGPESISVAANRTEWMLDLRVEEPSRPDWTVYGVVVDDAGAPLSGVEIFARQTDDRGYTVESSFGGGRFHLSGFPPEKGPVTFERIGRRPEYELLEPRHAVEPGTRGVRLVVRRLARVDTAFRVVAARDGSPVERFRFRSVEVDHAERETRLGGFKRSGSLMLGPSRRHAGGVIELDAVLAVDHLLVVVPEDPALQPVCFHEFRREASAIEPVEVPLEPSIRWRVRVTDPDGVPIAGSSVEFLRGVGRTRVTRRTFAPTMTDVFERGVWGTYLAIATSEATTDNGGFATLRTASDADGCAVRVRGRAHLDGFLALSGALTTDELREIEVEPAARIVGRLEPPELVAALGPSRAERMSAAILADPETELAGARIELELRPTGGGRGMVARVVDDGRFTLDAVPLGDYVLYANLPHISPDTRLVEIAGLRAGEVRELAVDLRPHRPATIRGMVRLDGAPPPARSRATLGRQSLELDAEGRFQTRLPPGRYACGLRVTDDVGSGRSSRYERRETLDVRPGETLDVVLDFVRRRVDFRVVDGDEAPVAAKWLALHAIGEDGEPAGSGDWLILDGDGRASLEGSWHEPKLAVLWLDPPPSRGPVRDEPPGRHVELGRVLVPAGKRTARYDFTVGPPEANTTGRLNAQHQKRH